MLVRRLLLLTIAHFGCDNCAFDDCDCDGWFDYGLTMVRRLLLSTIAPFDDCGFDCGFDDCAFDNCDWFDDCSIRRLIISVATIAPSTIATSTDGSTMVRRWFDDCSFRRLLISMDGSTTVRRLFDDCSFRRMFISTIAASTIVSTIAPFAVCGFDDHQFDGGSSPIWWWLISQIAIIFPFAVVIGSIVQFPFFRLSCIFSHLSLLYLLLKT